MVVVAVAVAATATARGARVACSMRCVVRPPVRVRTVESREVPRGHARGSVLVCRRLG